MYTNMKYQTIPPIPFTKDALDKIKKDYAALQKLREEVMIRLQTAREMGDLSENGAYKYAKFELGSIGRQMRELNHLISNGVVTEKKPGLTIVDFGSSVTVSDGKTENTFLIVSAHESDISQNKLSMDSPLGSALMSKSIGDKITVTAPSGDKSYTITDIT